MIIDNVSGKVTLEEKQRLLAAKTVDEFKSIIKEIFKRDRVSAADMGDEAVKHLCFLNGEYDLTVMRDPRRIKQDGLKQI